MSISINMEWGRDILNVLDNASNFQKISFFLEKKTTLLISCVINIYQDTYSVPWNSIKANLCNFKQNKRISLKGTGLLEKIIIHNFYFFYVYRCVNSHFSPPFKILSK